MLLVGFIIRIYHDARSSECQIYVYMKASLHKRMWYKYRKHECKSGKSCDADVPISREGKRVEGGIHKLTSSYDTFRVANGDEI